MRTNTNRTDKSLSCGIYPVVVCCFNLTSQSKVDFYRVGTWGTLYDYRYFNLFQQVRDALVRFKFCRQMNDSVIRNLSLLNLQASDLLAESEIKKRSKGAVSWRESEVDSHPVSIVNFRLLAIHVLSRQIVRPGYWLHAGLVYFSGRWYPEQIVVTINKSTLVSVPNDLASSIHFIDLLLLLESAELIP